MEPEERKRRALAEARRPITWEQLNAICRWAIRPGDPRTAEWKARIIDRVLQLGYSLPEPATFDRALDRNQHLIPASNPEARIPPRPTRARAESAEATRPDPTKIARSDPRARANFTPIAAMTGQQKNTGPLCNARRPVLGTAGLQCSRPRGHTGDHGLLNAGALFVRWARSEDDDP